MGTSTDVVTGALSFSGRYVARRLLDAGRTVRTLTGHPNRPDPFGGRIAAFPYDFERPARLIRSLEGAETLYNTYWVRYPVGALTFAKAVENSRVLFDCARKAGVRRVVHVSIAHPAKDSPLGYYAGKAQVEEALKTSGLSYAIFRPTVIFGNEDVLINNIAWMVRHFPLFGVPGDGQYRLQPIFVEDFADALVAAGARSQNEIRDAAGPETFTFDGLIREIARRIGRPARLMHLPPGAVYALTALLGKALGDTILTKEEIRGLMDNLLVSDEPPLGRTPLTRWLSDHNSAVGTRYASEMKRHF